MTSPLSIFCSVEQHPVLRRRCFVMPGGIESFDATDFVTARRAAFGVDPIRLIRQDDLSTFDVQMTTLRAELDEAVQQLDEHYGELRRRPASGWAGCSIRPTIRNRCGGCSPRTGIFPASIRRPYLQQLSPELYQQECRRVQARFDEAVQLAEQAFTEELAKLVSHLTERLSGQEDGKPKVFRDSAVENLGEFFERFRHLNVRSNEQLDGLVAQAQRTIRGVEPQQLRDNSSLRQHVATQLAGVQATLDGMLVDRPRRNILRRPRSTQKGAADHADGH